MRETAQWRKRYFRSLAQTFLRSGFVEGELQVHLQEEKASGLANRKNGKTTKKVKSLSGEFEL